MVARSPVIPRWSSIVTTAVRGRLDQLGQLGHVEAPPGARVCQASSVRPRAPEGRRRPDRAPGATLDLPELPPSLPRTAGRPAPRGRARHGPAPLRAGREAGAARLARGDRRAGRGPRPRADQDHRRVAGPRAHRRGRRPAGPSTCAPPRWRDAAALVGVDPAAPIAAGGDAPGPGELDVPLAVDPAAAEVLADWFAFGWRLLDRVVTDARAGGRRLGDPAVARALRRRAATWRRAVTPG